MLFFPTMKQVSASWLLTCNHRGLIQNGAMLIDGDTVVAVGQAQELARQFPQAQKENHPDAILMPGLINAHCHLDRLGFFERYPIETDTSLSPVAWLLEGLHYLSKTPSATVVKRMQEACQQMIASGITGVGTMVHYEGTFPILKSTPLRGVVFQEVLSGPDRQAQGRFEVALALMDKYLDATPGQLQMGFGPYSAYVLSRNLLNIIARHAKDLKVPLQIHAAETFAEMEFFFESKGPIATQLFPAIGWEELPPAHRKTPIQHLDEIGFFTVPFSIVGGYHLSAADFPRLARAMARVVYCPSANRRFKLGQFPFRQLKESGIPMALGTEITGDVEGFDLWEEMRLALKEGSNPLPLATDLLKMATLGGAFALGLETETGSLEPGKKADYLVVQNHAPSIETEEALCRALIQETQPSSVKQVVIGGKTVKG